MCSCNHTNIVCIACQDTDRELPNIGYLSPTGRVRILTMGENVIGAMVRRYRLVHKLTMADLGLIINKGHSYISQVEGGTLIPSAEVLGKLASALNVSADVLLGREAGGDENMIALLQGLGALEIDNPAAFLESLRSLPPNEQRIIARLVRLSALDHKMSQPTNIRKRPAQQTDEVQVGTQ